VGEVGDVGDAGDAGGEAAAKWAPSDRLANRTRVIEKQFHI
jgi:hypothetical protein